MSEPRSEPYLILHKVRGEPAFDIAERVVQLYSVDYKGPDLEDIWIIPTSGHRAYPIFSIEVGSILQEDVYKMFKEGVALDVPDHYRASEPPPSKARQHVLPSTTEDFAL